MPHQDYRVCSLIIFAIQRHFPPLSLSLSLTHFPYTTDQQSAVEIIPLLQSRIGQSIQAVELGATPQQERSIRAKVKPITIIILLRTTILIVARKFLSPALMMLMCPSL